MLHAKTLHMQMGIPCGSSGRPFHEFAEVVWVVSSLSCSQKTKHSNTAGLPMHAVAAGNLHWHDHLLTRLCIIA